VSKTNVLVQKWGSMAMQEKKSTLPTNCLRPENFWKNISRKPTGNLKPQKSSFKGKTLFSYHLSAYLFDV
jgi:hypothetical protein